MDTRQAQRLKFAQLQELKPRQMYRQKMQAPSTFQLPLMKLKQKLQVRPRQYLKQKQLSILKRVTPVKPKPSKSLKRRKITKAKARPKYKYQISFTGSIIKKRRKGRKLGTGYSPFEVRGGRGYYEQKRRSLI